MTITAYSYLVRRTIPLLTEAEWAEVEPLARQQIREVQEYRRTTGASLGEALKNPAVGRIALQKYTAMTGAELDHRDQIWAVQAARYGRLCPECGKPFRTPKAKLCAACGFQLPIGELAGPLTVSSV